MAFLPKPGATPPVMVCIVQVLKWHLETIQLFHPKFL
jgi:hypothetical protein